MLPAQQQTTYELDFLVLQPEAAAAAAVQRVDFPHRALLADGTHGAVMREFLPPLHANSRGRLRRDLDLYDIILFIARGYSMEVR